MITDLLLVTFVSVLTASFILFGSIFLLFSFILVIYIKFIKQDVWMIERREGFLVNEKSCYVCSRIDF